MSKKKQHHEEHVDETWLIPYADMLTLLLALFIVMFASSQMNQSKFQQMRDSFSNAFSGGSGMYQESSKLFTISTSPSYIESKKMEEMVEYLNEQIENSGLKDLVTTKITKGGVEISIQDKLLFASGDANIFADVSPILSSIAKALQGLNNDISVIGHTDNVPISNASFRSNWDLSAIRAINVINYLVREGNLNPQRFVVHAHGEYMPKYDNSTEAGRAGNRRVEIIIARKYPLSDEEADLLDKKSGSYFYENPKITAN